MRAFKLRSDAALSESATLRCVSTMVAV